MGNFIYIALLVFGFALGVSQSKDTFWSYFVFTQQWPLSACIDGNATKHNCQIPLNVTTWTVHGLWPSDPSKPESPSNCNSSWKFDERKIKTIEDKMKKFWPNLYMDSPTTEFWQHEWEKHGTCSTNLRSTADEHLYFSQGLLLNEYYNLTALFEKNNIVPGNRTYKLDQFNEVISAGYKGYQPIIECVMNKTKGQEEIQYIYQIELCLNKEFAVIECPKHHHHDIQNGDCSGKEEVNYMYKSNDIVTGLCSSKKPIHYPKIEHP